MGMFVCGACAHGCCVCTCMCIGMSVYGMCVGVRVMMLRQGVEVGHGRHVSGHGVQTVM